MANPTVLPNNMPGSAAKTRRPLLDFSKRFRNPILLILSIVLIILAIWLVSVLIAKTFSSIFTCNHLISKPLGTSILCDGVTFPHFNFLGIDVGPYPIVPELKVIDKPLDAVRKFIVWNIIATFGVVSLILAFIVIKIKGFVKTLQTPEGRKAVLTNFSIWLFIFAVFCGLFYFGVVVH